jgi:hypothetical protein
MRKLRSTVQLALVVLCVVDVSAAPNQLQDFRMAAQIEHFDITCAPEFDGQAAVISPRAENAYQRVASSLQHDLSFRPLLVLFETRAEQMRAVETRTIPGNREHVIVALDMPGAGSEDNLVHELSHVFLFDVLSPALHGNVPVWILEGLAEHQRGQWEAADITVLSNMVETGTMPTLSDVSTGRVDTRRSAVFGHAAFDFLASRTGIDGAQRFVAALRANPGITPQNAYLASLGLDVDFDRAFAEYSRRRVRP